MKKLAKTKSIAEVFLYAVLLIIGLSIVMNPWVGESNPLFYIACMFIIFAFFSFFAYFLGKEEDDYELLLLSLINVVMAVFLYYYREGDLPLILSYSLSAWSFFYISLKLITAFLYKDNNPKKYSLKMFITAIILILSSFSIFKLYNDDILLDLMVYGYYFVIISVLNFLEVCLNRIVFEKDDTHTFKLMPDSYYNPEKSDPIKILVEDIELVEVEEEPVEDVKKVAEKSTAKKTSTKKTTTKKATTKKTSSTAKKKTTKKTTK